MTKPSYTQRIDTATLAIGGPKRIFAGFVALFFVFLVVFYLVVSVMRLFKYPEENLEPLAVSLFLAGILFTPAVLITAVAVHKALGRLFWWALIVGAVLVALGPTLTLILEGWDTEVWIPGRWLPGEIVTLSDVALLNWGLSALMFIPGVLGVIWPQIERRRA